MHGQWCIKGVPKRTDSEAGEIFVTSGLKCRWWQLVDPFPFGRVPHRLDDLRSTRNRVQQDSETSSSQSGEDMCQLGSQVDSANGIWKKDCGS
jgi:hypothetical protein